MNTLERERTVRDPSVWIVTAVCGLAVALAALAEVGWASCFPAKTFVSYGLFWTAVLSPALLWRQSWTKLGAVGMMFLSLAVLYSVPWNSRKVFLRDFAKIRIGMTRQQVETIMGAYMKGTGWPAIPGGGSSPGTFEAIGSDSTLRVAPSSDGELAFEDAVVYRHSDAARFNSDWGVVRFRNGKVVGKEFLPD